MITPDVITRWNETATTHPGTHPGTQAPDADGLPESSGRTVAEIYDLCFTVTSFIGIPGNFLAFLVLISSKQLRQKNINIFLLHQAFIDLIVFTFDIGPRFTSDYTVLPWAIREFGCRMWFSFVLRTGSFNVSGYNLMFLTLERYWAVTKPLSYDETKVRKRLPFVFLASWVCGFGSVFPKIVTTRIVDLGPTITVCWPYIDIKSKLNFTLTSAYYMLMACAIPSIVMVYCYIVMGRTLMRSRKFQQQQQQKDGTKSTLDAAQANVIQTCAIVAVMFVTFRSLHIFAWFLQETKSINDPNLHFFTITAILLGMNSTMNPYVYCLRIYEVKSRIMTILRLESPTIKRQASVSQKT